MNKGTLVLIGVVLLAGGWYVFTKEDRQVTPKTDDTVVTTQTDEVTPKAGNYSIDTEASVIGWSGQKPLISGYVHKGVIKFKEGSITIGDATASGSFIIDMNTIEATSLGGGKAGKESALEKHLKSADFFNVEKFPTASVTIESVSPVAGVANEYTVSGTLSIVGKSNPITFPAKIVADKNGVLHANATLSIDRTVWGITYGSGSFFDNMANNAIDNTIALELSVVATNINATMEEGTVTGEETDLEIR